MWDKIENYLFDILGLLVPGLVLIISILVVSLALLNEKAENGLNKFFVSTDFPLVSIWKTISASLVGSWLIIIVSVIMLYLCGHLVKTFSKVYYDFCSNLFDKGLFRWVYNKKTVNKKQNQDPKLGLFHKIKIVFFDCLKGFLSFFYRGMKNVVTYNADNYEPANKSLVGKTVDLINEHYNTDYPREWYSIYKFSKIVGSNEDLKSLSNVFLAKYNLYRSLSFISFVIIIYVLILHFKFDNYINASAGVMLPFILISSFLCWYTFHLAYKRYFRLCGNEALISLFYFLNEKHSKIKE
jgi:hypothetical protein